MDIGGLTALVDDGVRDETVPKLLSIKERVRNRLVLRLVEAEIQERLRIDVVRRVFILQHDRHQMTAILLGHGNQRIAGKLCIAGLAGDDTGIRIGSVLAKHLMLHIDGQTARISDRPRHLVGRMGLDLQEVPVLHRFRTDQCHIIGTGVVVLGIEAGRICEVAVLAAEACRLRIHHVDEGLAGTRHMAGECIAALIRRFQQQCVETVPYRQDVALFDLGIRRSGVDIVHVIMTEGHLLVEVTVLQYHERGQHLRDRRRGHLFVHVLLKQDRPGVRVEDDAGARGEIRIREVPRGVRVHREERRPQGTYEKGHEDGSAGSAPSPVMMIKHFTSSYLKNHKNSFSTPVPARTKRPPAMIGISEPSARIAVMRSSSSYGIVMSVCTAK